MASHLLGHSTRCLIHWFYQPKSQVIAQVVLIACFPWNRSSTFRSPHFWWEFYACIHIYIHTHNVHIYIYIYIYIYNIYIYIYILYYIILYYHISQKWKTELQCFGESILNGSRLGQETRETAQCEGASTAAHQVGLVLGPRRSFRSFRQIFFTVVIYIHICNVM